ncbi:MAG: hypothetical protein IPG12_04385 [Saprospiraceae bacterium]|nr:hypothetical protein [Saprospiraceae bacterium]
MYKYLLLISILWVSCASPKLAIYKTIPNDVALIDLYLQKNHRFGVNFKDFDEVPPKTYLFKGHWKEAGESIRLEFKLSKNDIPDINALFDPSLNEHRSVKIIDKKTIEFKKNAKRIHIWGLPCVKLELKK